jgi:hypothetical protein
MNIKNKIEYIDLLEYLSDAFSESDDQSVEEIRRDFREDGFDIDTAETRILAFQKEISMVARRQTLDEAAGKRKNNQLISQKVKEKVKNLSSEQVINRIKALIRIYPEMAVSYRGLESTKSEDLRSLLEDLEAAHHFSEGDE